MLAFYAGSPDNKRIHFLLIFNATIKMVWIQYVLRMPGEKPDALAQPYDLC